MINPKVLAECGTTWRNVPHLPVNVCRHCGAEDDPETTHHWPEDSEGDRVCPACAEKDSMATMTLDRVEAAVARAYIDSEFGTRDEVNYFDALLVVILARQDLERVKSAQRKIA